MQDWVYRLDHDAVVVAESRLPAPLVTYLGDGRWRLERAYEYRDGNTTIRVPAGLEFDLSSVPRVFWSFIAPFELSIAAPLLHDFLPLRRKAAGRIREPAAGVLARGGRSDVSRDHASRGSLGLASHDWLRRLATLRPVGVARLSEPRRPFGSGWSLQCLSL